MLHDIKAKAVAMGRFTPTLVFGENWVPMLGGPCREADELCPIF